MAGGRNIIVGGDKLREFTSPTTGDVLVQKRDRQRDRGRRAITREMIAEMAEKLDENDPFPGIQDGQKRRFLAALAMVGTTRGACKFVDGVEHYTVYRWKKSDEKFLEMFEYASEKPLGDILYEEAVHRAVDGVKEEIYYKGEVVGEKLVYSDSLLLALLKAVKPDLFVERVEVQHRAVPTLPDDDETINEVAKVLAPLAEAAPEEDGEEVLEAEFQQAEGDDEELAS